MDYDHVYNDELIYLPMEPEPVLSSPEPFERKKRSQDDMDDSASPSAAHPKKKVLRQSDYEAAWGEPFLREQEALADEFLSLDAEPVIEMEDGTQELVDSE